MITIEQYDGITDLRITRPPVNAFDHAILKELRELINKYQQNQEHTKAIILSGLPGIFTAGLDLPSLTGLNREAMQAFWEDFYGLWRAIALSPVPVVAAITGHSPAGGTVLSVFCDYRIMAAGDYKIGLNEVQVGLVAPAPIYKAMSRLCGARVAEHHLVAGDLINPEEALAIGLIDEVVPTEQVVPRAVEWCRKHLCLPPAALQATRRVARAELFDIFAEPDDGSNFLKLWFSDETQTTLKQVIASLGKKAHT